MEYIGLLFGADPPPPKPPQPDHHIYLKTDKMVLYSTYILCGSLCISYITVITVITVKLKKLEYICLIIFLLLVS